MLRKYILMITLALFILDDCKAVKVNFSTLQYSKSVLVGTEKLEINFLIVPDNYNDSTVFNFADTLNFPNIDYNNIKEVAIDEIILTNNLPNNFNRIATFINNDTIIYGGKLLTDFIQGESHLYRLVLIMNDNSEINLYDKNVILKQATPLMRCAKLNNIYRKACHNCFQESIVIA